MAEAACLQGAQGEPAALDSRQPGYTHSGCLLQLGLALHRPWSYESDGANTDVGTALYIAAAGLTRQHHVP